MESLFTFMPLFKVAASFAAMVLGIRFRIGLWQSILGGAILLGVLFGMGPAGMLGSAGDAMTDPKAVYLMIIISLILTFSELQDSSGQSRRLMEAVTGRIRSRRLRLVFFPALIGLLPMPGGAIFSAPMVKSAADGMNVSPEHKSQINYWFRHIWEFSWPLYPGVILASGLCGLTLTEFAVYMSSGTIFSAIVGYYFFLRASVIDLSGSKRVENEASWSDLFREGAPLLIAIGGAIGMEMIISMFAHGIAFEFGIMASLALGCVWIIVQNRMGLGPLMKSLTSRKLVSMVLLIVVIFIYKQIMGDAGAVDQLSRMAGQDVAIIASATFLPFVVGLVSGITLAYVGASFPLLMGLLAQAGVDNVLPWAVLAMFVGYTGVLLSPIHVCLVLTCDYFTAELGKAWKMMVIPCMVLLAFGGVMFWLVS